MVEIFKTPSGEEVAITEGFVTIEVAVDLSDIISSDLEGFLDLISEAATGSPLLMDITYNMIRVTALGALQILVTGDVSEILSVEGN